MVAAHDCRNLASLCHFAASQQHIMIAAQLAPAPSLSFNATSHGDFAWCHRASELIYCCLPTLTHLLQDPMDDKAAKLSEVNNMIQRKASQTSNLGLPPVNPFSRNLAAAPAAGPPKATVAARPMSAPSPGESPDAASVNKSPQALALLKLLRCCLVQSRHEQVPGSDQS